jgi:hypothetical protein
MSELLHKVTALLEEHFADERHSAAELDIDLIEMLVALSAAVIANDPASIPKRRALFDKMLTKGLYDLASRRRR